MYSIKSLVLLLSILINISFGNFINFIPYDNSDCTGSVSGGGWSILEYSCFSIDVRYNYQFTTHTLNGEGFIQWTQFPRVVGKTQCFYQDLPISNASIGSCYKNTAESTFDIFRSLPTNQYYLISVTSEPYYPTNQLGMIVLQYMGNGECSNDNIEIIQYFTNNTESVDGITGIQMNWYCNHANEPYESQCFNGKNCFDMPQQYKCSHTHPFFNTSDEISGGTGAGDYSGTGSGSSSGNSGTSDGGSSSGSGSGSGSGAFISINVDQKQYNNNNNKNNNNNNNNHNNQFEKSTGDGDITKPQNNYITSFCT
ncbi:hypothetical protein RB653_009312 [Dictyostelium firmibasis]|uniref:Uncharacterized protein n=1 Tax=Dictyostelium firmibasis TaxID=79012 RepID=A0AAN7U0U4_9MYCE